MLINFTRIFVEKCRGSTNRPRAIEIRMIIGTKRRMRLVGLLSKYTDHQIHILYSLCVFEDTDHPEIFIERLVDSRIFWDDQKVITKVGLEQPTHLS